MNNISNQHFKNLIYTVLFYIVGVMLSNFLMRTKMKWSTFFILLFSLVFGHIIRYLLYLKEKG